MRDLDRLASLAGLEPAADGRVVVDDFGDAVGQPDDQFSHGVDDAGALELPGIAVA